MTEEELELEQKYLRNFDDVPAIPDDIQETYDELRDAYKRNCEKNHIQPENIDNDLVLLDKAFVFAFKAHRNQKRKNGDMYITHPLATAMILVELDIDIETMAGALLHDTIEDTAADYNMVKQIFGESIANLVDGVTKIGKLPYSSKEESQAASTRKMLIAMAKDLRVILIKLADRLHNMRTMKHQTPEKQIEKARETLDIYVPFAERFGIYKMKWELEDLCLRYIDKDAYYQLVGMISKKRSEREQYMTDVVQVLDGKLRESGLTHFEIEGRPKHFYSIYKKMKDKNKTLDEIYDLFACRIIVDTITDCYTVLGIVHKTFNPMPDRFKDYIAVPKDNKYQSLHTTVLGKDGTPFEVQIRTYAMHRTAEYGIAAHWHYKESGGSRAFTMDKMDDKMNWIRQLIDSQKETKDSGEFLDYLKTNIAPEEVYVFTPKGDIVRLPQGSCPIDFAYNIHSGIGNHMHGAKVNGRIVPLTYQLKNGDIVEIMSSDKIKGPSRDWVKFVRTTSAKNKINAWFKKEEREENIALGKELLEREIQRNGFSTQQLLVHKPIESVLKKYSTTNLEDVYASIGYGSLSVQKVFGKLRDEYIKSLPEAERMSLGYRVTGSGQVVYSPDELPTEIGKGSQLDLPKIKPPRGTTTMKTKTLPSTSRKSGGDNGVVVDGLSNVQTKLSKCCHPVPGDDVIGYITQNGGVGIHRKDCKNIMNIIRYSERSKKDEERYNRLIEARWDSSSENKPFDVAIVIISNDRHNLISDITTTISDEYVFINKISSISKKNFTVETRIVMDVKSQEQYDRVIGRLKTIKDIVEVRRM